VSLVAACVAIGIWFEGCGLTATLADSTRQWSNSLSQNTKIGLKYHLFHSTNVQIGRANFKTYTLYKWIILCIYENTLFQTFPNHVFISSHRLKTIEKSKFNP
jgi:hypothetical protein